MPASFFLLPPLFFRSFLQLFSLFQISQRLISQNSQQKPNIFAQIKRGGKGHHRSGHGIVFGAVFASVFGWGGGASFCNNGGEWCCVVALWG
jgi:hypothetical protein